MSKIKTVTLDAESLNTLYDKLNDTFFDFHRVDESVDPKPFGSFLTQLDKEFIMEDDKNLIYLTEGLLSIHQSATVTTKDEPKDEKWVVCRKDRQRGLRVYFSRDAAGTGYWSKNPAHAVTHPTKKRAMEECDGFSWVGAKVRKLKEEKSKEPKRWIVTYQRSDGKRTYVGGDTPDQGSYKYKDVAEDASKALNRNTYKKVKVMSLNKFMRKHYPTLNSYGK